MNTESDSDLLRKAFRRIDQRNATDPRRVQVGDQSWPQGELYGRRMSEWLERVEPDASPALQLACRAQHLARHEMPRAEFPSGRAGYLAWRKRCKQRHAELASEILVDLGFDLSIMGRVSDLIEKKRIKSDSEAQTLEDVACLVFLEDHFADFSQQHDEEKLVNILRKTWFKMSERGQGFARALELDAPLQSLVERALAGPPTERP